jgi:MFS family permease
MDASYGALFAHPRARELMAGLIAAWLSFGMVGLSIFLVTRRATGSYGFAGVAVAAFSVGSGALAPFRGRLIDRNGVRPWLLLLALGYGAGLFTVAVLSRVTASPGPLIACSAISGVSAPPVIASLRALWPLVVDSALVRRAYAVTSVVGDMGLVAAPAIAALLFVWISWLPLTLTAALALFAAFVLGRGGQQRQTQAEQAEGSDRLLGRRFAVLLVVELALGLALGLVEVGVPSAAARWGLTGYSGLLLAAFGLGSVIGGIWFGSREWKSPAVRRYLVAALVVAAALLPPVAATGAATLAPLLVVAGLAYGPATISLFEALDELTTSRAAEALTWITTAGAVGTALGSASGGWLVSGPGLWCSFIVASFVLATATATGFMLRHQ